jgi:hypothetical protein
MRPRVERQVRWLLDQRHGMARSLAKRDQDTDDPTHELAESGHDRAVGLLHIAAEIEHVLMVQYLYAAYSLGGEKVPKKHRELVTGWQEIILGVAKEEMAHLITVQNVLRLLGGPLNLDRNDYPWDAPFYPFAFALEPLSLDSLARYVYAESPKVWPHDVEAWEKEDIIKRAGSDAAGKLHQVGELYSAIIRLLANEKEVPDDCFDPDTLPYQSSWDEWGRGYRQGRRGTNIRPRDHTPDLLIGTAYSRETAVRALQAVAEQGEAADIDPGTDARSHFRRFLTVFREFRDKQKGWSATIRMATNPRATGGQDPIKGTTYLENRRSRLWARLCNLRYRMLMVSLSHAFNLSGEDGLLPDAKARGMLTHRTFGEMYNVRAISRLLTRMPVGAPEDDLWAGPPFEMPYTMKLPRSERGCWQVHLDMLESSRIIVAKILPGSHAQEREFLEALSRLDESASAAMRKLSGKDADVSHVRRLERPLV